MVLPKKITFAIPKSMKNCTNTMNKTHTTMRSQTHTKGEEHRQPNSHQWKENLLNRD